MHRTKKYRRSFELHQHTGKCVHSTLEVVADNTVFIGFCVLDFEEVGRFGLGAANQQERE
jgi:hypothetical protein